jgi:cytochrome c-type biogenesis protein CcmH/NrfF
MTILIYVLNLKIANKIRLDILEELSQGYSLKNINKKIVNYLKNI